MNKNKKQEIVLTKEGEEYMKAVYSHYLEDMFDFFPNATEQEIVKGLNFVGNSDENSEMSAFIKGLEIAKADEKAKQEKELEKLIYNQPHLEINGTTFIEWEKVHELLSRHKKEMGNKE